MIFSIQLLALSSAARLTPFSFSLGEDGFALRELLSLFSFFLPLVEPTWPIQSLEQILPFRFSSSLPGSSVLQQPSSVLLPMPTSFRVLLLSAMLEPLFSLLPARLDVRELRLLLVQQLLVG